MIKSFSKLKILNLIFLFIAVSIVNSYNPICFADVRTDFTSPVLDKIVMYTNTGSYINGSTAYLKGGDSIFFDLYLVEPDSISSLSYIEFSIGTQTGLRANVNNEYEWNPTTIARNTFNIGSNQNYEGEINITDIFYTDSPGDLLTGATLTYTGTTTSAVIDNTNPEIIINNDFAGIPTLVDNINISVNDSNTDSSSFKYVFSVNGDCNNEDYSNGVAFESGVDFSFDYSEVANNGKYLCVIAKDLVGNVSYMSSNYVLNVLYDSDGDKVPDGAENLEGTNIYDINDYLDSDGDKVPNYIEINNGTEIGDNTSYNDYDNDFVPNYVEEIQGTNIIDIFSYTDLDGDLIADYVEILEGTDPNNINSYLDTDGDGVPDYYEKVYDSSDYNNQYEYTDEDLDGVPNYVEFVQGTNMYDEYSFLDSDNDGIPDYVENQV